jgi:hypothetical protein
MLTWEHAILDNLLGHLQHTRLDGQRSRPRLVEVDAQTHPVFDLEPDHPAFSQELRRIAHSQDRLAFQFTEDGAAGCGVVEGQKNNLATWQALQRVCAVHFKRPVLLGAPLEGLLQHVAKRIAAQDADAPRRAAVGKRAARPGHIVGEIAQEGGLDFVRVFHRGLLSVGLGRHGHHEQYHAGHPDDPWPAGREIETAFGGHGRGTAIRSGP